MEFGYRSALGAILMNTNAESRQLKKVYKNKSNAKYFSKLIGILTRTYLELMYLLSSTSTMVSSIILAIFAKKENDYYT